MPRYIARVKVTRTYRRYHAIAGEAGGQAEWTKSALGQPLPVHVEGDWILEPPSPLFIHGDPSFGDGKWRGHVASVVIGHKPMTIYANSESEAEKLATEGASHIRGDVFQTCTWDRDWHAEAVEITSIRRDDAPTRPRRRFAVDIRPLIAPNCTLYPLSIDQAFETLRWMVSTSRNYASSRMRHVTMHQLLSANSDGTLNEGVRPVSSIKDLKSRFAYAVLGQGDDIYQQWRDEHGIHPTASLVIDAPHYGANSSKMLKPRNRHTGPEDLDDVLRHTGGMTLAHALNNHHPGLRHVRGVAVRVAPDSFTFVLTYGEAGAIGSRWEHVLARTRGREPFVETLDRALDAIDLLIPDYADQRSRILKEQRT